jgi:hypothetical protein
MPVLFLLCAAVAIPAELTYQKPPQGDSGCLECAAPAADLGKPFARLRDSDAAVALPADCRGGAAHAAAGGTAHRHTTATVRTCRFTARRSRSSGWRTLPILPVADARGREAGRAGLEPRRQAVRFHEHHRACIELWIGTTASGQDTAAHGGRALNAVMGDAGGLAVRQPDGAGAAGSRESRPAARGIQRAARPTRAGELRPLRSGRDVSRTC